MTGAEVEREEAQVLPGGAKAELSGSSCPRPPEEFSGGPADLTQEARLTLAMQVPPTHLLIYSGANFYREHSDLSQDIWC